MARIRTIKPEFWSSEQVMSCSPLARLLFIGLWNFCDDGGNHPLAPRTLKALVFPGDSITADEVSELLQELKSAGLTEHYCAEDRHYLHVRGWRHQKIEKKNFKYPAPGNALDERSATPSRAVAEQSSTVGQAADTGREGERTGTHNTPSAQEHGGLAFPMTLEWSPDLKLLRAYAARMELPVELFTQQSTAAFVCHYASCERRETAAAWVSLLVKWVKRDRVVANNVRTFPTRRPTSGPDFDDITWAADLGVL
jgi:hypothetical protein